MPRTIASRTAPKDVAAADVRETRERLGFEEMKATTGMTLYTSETKADYPTSKRILGNANLTFLTYQEALSTIMKDRKLKNLLKDKWFWLAGTELNKKLELYTIDDRGELVERKGKVSIEKTIHVWNGTNPLSLDVHAGDFAVADGGRFYLDAYVGPGNVAPVVVGKVKPKQAATNVAAAKLLRKIKEANVSIHTKLCELEKMLRPT